MVLDVLKAPNGEDAFRLLLTLNNLVGMILCFVGGRAIYFVLGTTLIVSMIFNVVSISLQGKETRRKMKKNEPIRPNIFALCIEIFGTGALLTMFIISVIDTTVWDNYYWNSSPFMAVHLYAGMTGINAFIMHGFMSVKKIVQYVRYCQSFRTSCPHCKRGYVDRVPGEVPAMEPSPLALGACETHSPRVSFSANIEGEGENDNLIMKQ